MKDLRDMVVEDVTEFLESRLPEVVGYEYAKTISDKIRCCVAEDVILCSAVQEEGCVWNQDDIRLAVGRILIEHLGIQT